MSAADDGNRTVSQKRIGATSAAAPIRSPSLPENLPNYRYRLPYDLLSLPHHHRVHP